MSGNPRNLAAIPVVGEAVMVKGGGLTKIKVGGKEVRWDYALCSGVWFKVECVGEGVRWREEYNTIHGVEKCAKNGRRLYVWYYNGKGGGYPKLCCRELQADNEGDRDDWVLTFRSLLMNYWHERLESTLIPAPEVYQFHLFTSVPSDASPHLVALSTQKFRVIKLPQATESVTVAECSFTSLANITRKNPTTLVFQFSDGQSLLTLSTKDSIESLLVIAEVNRLVRMATGKTLTVK